jgi:hypothetical protein
MKKIIIFTIGIIFIDLILFPICIKAAVVKEEKIKLNDDLYVEIKAQVNFVMSQVFEKYKGMKALAKATEAENSIYKKFGVTKEEVNNYINELSEKDVSRTTKVIMKVAQRMQELMDGAKKEPEPVSEKNGVKGFPGIPVYIGAEFISGTQMEDMLAKEGYIWYEFGEKLCEEYNEDPKGVDNRIVDFYKKELAKKGWKYIGEGVRTYHLSKGNNAIGITFPADCTIEYRHMSTEEAKGNCGKMEEDQFIEAFIKCAAAAQEICKKQGIQNMNDYMTQMADEKALEMLTKKVEIGLNETLKPYGVTFKRFKEIKAGYNSDKIMRRLYTEHEKEMNALQLGLMFVSR